MVLLKFSCRIHVLRAFHLAFGRKLGLFMRVVDLTWGVFTCVVLEMHQCLNNWDPGLAYGA